MRENPTISANEIAERLNMKAESVRYRNKLMKQLFLTESSKSPASSAWSAQRWVGDLLVSGGVQTPPDKPRSGYEVMSK